MCARGLFGWLLGSRGNQVEVRDTLVGGDVIGGDKVIIGLQASELQQVILAMDQAHRDERSKLPLYRPSFIRNSIDYESLSFKNSAISFRGRAAEFSEIANFLDSPEPFLWWIVTGSAGVGKSKFALELCLRVHGYRKGRTWVAGFLNARDARRLDMWEASHETLIVIDYVQRNADEVREGLLSLARHCRAGLSVRVLLLERSFDKLERSRLFGSSRGELESVCYRTDSLPLRQLDEEDIWKIVQTFFGAKAVLPDPEEFFAKLSNIDSERRMLVALILATLYQSKDTDPLSDISELMTAYIMHERATHWPRDPAIRSSIEEPLIALGTIAGGITRGQVTSLPDNVKELIDQLDSNERNPCRLITTCEEPDMLCGVLTPDLLGEFFALDAVSKQSLGSGQPSFPWLIESAWHLNGPSTLDFAVRCKRDFPTHPALRAFLLPATGVSQSYFLCMVNQILDSKINFYEAMKIFKDQAISDRSITTAIIQLGGMSLAPEFLESIIDKKQSIDIAYLMLTLANAHEMVPEFRTAWANAVVNLTAFTYNKDHKEAYRKVKELERVMRQHTAEATLRLAWAASVNNYVTHHATKNTLAPFQLVVSLAKEARAHPDETELVEQWGTAIRNFVDTTRGSQVDRSYKLVDGLGDVARERKDHSALWAMWADAIENFTIDSTVTNSKYARSLIGQLKQESHNQNDAALIQKWADAEISYISHAASAHLAECRGILMDFDERMQLAPNDSAARLNWASAITNIIFAIAKIDQAEAWKLVAILGTKTEYYPDDEPLREKWCSAMADFISCIAGLGENERERGYNLIEIIENEMRTHKDQANLRIIYARTVSNFIGQAPLLSVDKKNEYSRAVRLFDNVNDLMRAFPDEQPLRVEWANAVIGFSRFGWQNMDSFRDLCELVLEMCAKYPGEKILTTALKIC